MKKLILLIYLVYLWPSFLFSQEKTVLEFRIAKMQATDGYQKVKMFGTGVPIFLKKDNPLIITQAKTVKVEMDPNGKPTGISIVLTQPDAEKFAKLTEESIGEKLAMILDKKVLSTPEIKEKIGSGSIFINRGYLMADEIQNLVGNFPIEGQALPEIKKEDTKPSEVDLDEELPAVPQASPSATPPTVEDEKEELP